MKKRGLFKRIFVKNQINKAENKSIVFDTVSPFRAIDKISILKKLEEFKGKFYEYERKNCLHVNVIIIFPKKLKIHFQFEGKNDFESFSNMVDEKYIFFENCKCLEVNLVNTEGFDKGIV